MQRVSQAEAARRLDVNRSTISRWVKNHPALADEAGRVDLEELRRHRETQIHPGNQTKTRAKKSTPADASGKSAGRAPEALNDHRARRENANAANAELDLADRLKLTVRREDVEAAAADAGEAIKQRAFQIVRDKAEALARIDDVRGMEKALEDIMHDLLSTGARALRKMAEDKGADAA